MIDVKNLIGGGALKAFMTTIAEGEEHPDTKTTIGVSKYLLVFPTLKKSMGLEVRITAHHDRPTAYDARLTALTHNEEQIMRELYSR